MKGFKKGDRVAIAAARPAHTPRSALPAAILLKVPSGIDDKQAAAMMLMGMTTEYLDPPHLPCKKGDIVLFHAAAGGVGLFGRAGAGREGDRHGVPPEKAAIKKHGYHRVIDYSKDVVARVKEITKGKGVPVVYDGVGKDTWEMSLNCLAPRGMMVSFGNASGPVAPFAPAVLGAKGSLFLTRPSLGSYTATRKELEACAKALFKVVKSGKVKVHIDQTYPLKDAAQAHRDLESRKTTGQRSDPLILLILTSKAESKECGRSVESPARARSPFLPCARRSVCGRRSGHLRDRGRPSHPAQGRPAGRARRRRRSRYRPHGVGQPGRRGRLP